MRFRRIFFTFFICAMMATIKSHPAQAQESQDSAKDAAGTGPKVQGSFSITSNYMNEAVSYSNNSFAVQPSFALTWKDWEEGLFSSNVQFPDNGESLDIRPYLSYDLKFAADVDIRLRFDYNLFYSSNTRNGYLMTFDINTFKHHFIIEQNGNWYGTGQSALWLAYRHSWPWIWGLDFKFDGGYLMTGANNYSSYFGVQAGLGYKFGNFVYELMTSFNSDASQFAGTAATGIWGSLSTKF